LFRFTVLNFSRIKLKLILLISVQISYQLFSQASDKNLFLQKNQKLLLTDQKYKNDVCRSKRILLVLAKIVAKNGPWPELARLASANCCAQSQIGKAPFKPRNSPRISGNEDNDCPRG